MNALDKGQMANAVAHGLQGTCLETIESQLEGKGYPAELADDLAFLSMIDDRVFRCSCCDWWCEISEMAEERDDWCDECAADNSDDDE